MAVTLKNVSSPYVITCASSQTGSACAKFLIDKGLPVRLIVRNASKVEHLRLKGAEVVESDITDTNKMIEAMKGSRAVYFMNPPTYHEDMFETADKVYKTFLSAAEAANVTKLVCLSTVGAHIDKGTGNIYTGYMMEKDFAYLSKNTSLTFLRCAWFMSNWQNFLSKASEAGELKSLLNPVSLKIPMIDPEDIGQTSAELLSDSHVSGLRIVNLRGPEDYSAEDVAKAISEVSQKVIKCSPFSTQECRHMFDKIGFDLKSINAWIEMLEGFNNGTITFPKDENVEERIGKTSISDFVKKGLNIGNIG